MYLVFWLLFLHLSFLDIWVLLVCYLLLFIAVYYLGDWLSKLYIKKHKELGSLVRLVAWSNVLTWLLPPLAILTATATFNFSAVSSGDDRKGFRILASIGLLLAIINAIWGILQRLNTV